MYVRLLISQFADIIFSKNRPDLNPGSSQITNPSGSGVSTAILKSNIRREEWVAEELKPLRKKKEY